MTARCGIICAGNWIVDIVHEIAQWPREGNLVHINSQSVDIGGGAANVSAVLAKLETGLPLWPMGAVGEDDYGRIVLERCRNLGFDTDAIRVNRTAATAHTHVMLVPGQSRTFFYQGGVNDKLHERDFSDRLLDGCSAKIFYLGYLMLLGALDRPDSNGETGAARILSRTRDAGMITCVDLVSIAHPEFAASVQSALPQIDYLILNEVEAALATGQAVSEEGAMLPDSLLADMARQLLAGGVRQAVVLHTPEIALWIGADGKDSRAKTVPLAPQEVISPLGAGDAFCAGLMYAIHEGWSAERSLVLANATARTALRGVTACETVPSLKELGHMVEWPSDDAAIV